MSIDILIAGAGPNGLMVACELALAGVRPVVLERLTGPSTEQRANGLVGQVVRALDRRGLYERLSGTPAPPQPAPNFMFAAFPLDLSVLPDNPVYLLMVPQRRIEQMLAERAAELGVEVRRGHEVTGLRQDADGVAVDVTGPDGPYRVQARYLVGADGGHSVTRKLAGIGFPGTTNSGVVSRTAHVSLDPDLVDPATGGLNVPGYGVIPAFLHHRTEHGLISFARFPNGPFMISTNEVGAELDESTPFTLDELRASVQRVLGVDVPLGPPPGDGPHLLRRLGDRSTRLAERYRAGRILLVGDAAHVHSALGGPGLNLGLQDAINLGWKLAAEVNGWAPPGLLDSYETERRPAGLRVTMHTQAQSVLVGPGAQITALRQVFGELLTDRHNVQRIADLFSGADIRYDMSDGNASPLVGRWAPDLDLRTSAGATRLATLTRTGRPLLIDLTDGADLADEAAPWRDRVDPVRATSGDRGVTALLLRPDCYVAWASASPRPDARERGALRTALTRWFGQPVPESANSGMTPPANAAASSRWG